LSYRGKLAKAVAVSTLVLPGAFALWACGPFFPPWLLTDESGILEAPTTWLREALQPLLPAGKPAFTAVIDEKGPYRQTAAADRADLEAALTGMPAERRQSLIDGYGQTREAIVKLGESLDAWREEAMWADPKPPRPETPALAVPPGLPGEFEDYLRGAIAYHQGKPDAARAAWQKLLARPAAERRYRTSWAAFMLGKVSLEKDPAAAIQGFQRTRELVGQGFPDPLGLAAASLGWQARAELLRKKYDEALKIYLQQAKAGDPSAVPSIRRTASKALDDPEGLVRVARSPEARAIETAYVLSRWDRVDYDGPLDPAPAKKWLAALRSAGVTQAEGADRLAWIAYRAGDFAAAEQWLGRAPADAPMARWVRAKLLLRSGKVAEADPLLAQAAAALPATAPADDLWLGYDNDVHAAVRPRALGELGANRLTQGQYAPALDALLHGGYWTDAAYVAERVLTVDELRAYVDESWPAALAAPYKPGEGGGEDWETQYAGLAQPPAERIAYDLRYLLGRRLVRAGRTADARPYLPAAREPGVEMLQSSLAEGRDAARSAEERARALFRAACVTRYQGLELQGTEIEPDWFLFGAEYDTDSFAAGRADPKMHRHLGPSPDEQARVRQTRTEPAKRFHYRYRGAALARSAADLLPSGSVERARILATAGNWLEGRDPQAARPFLDAILSCCANTDVGIKSRKANAVSNIEDACEAGTKPVAEEEGSR
jgi:hypothetical protein